MRSLILIALALLISISSFAQPGPKERGMRGTPPLKMLKSELALSDEQVRQLDAIHEKYRTELKAVADNTTTEDRRAAVRELLEKQKEEVNAVLTEEQKNKLEELRSQRPERREAFGERGKPNEELVKELRTYQRETIQPVLQTQRTKLEAVINVQDKATIAQLREALKPKRGDRMQNGSKERPDEDERAAMKANMESLRTLVERYSDAINRLQAEIEPQQVQWKEDLKKIHNKYAPEKKEEPAKKRFQGASDQTHSKGPKGDREARFATMHKARFLLMDPATNLDDDQIDDQTLELESYPNPSASVNTINYKVVQDGNVRIELRNKSGNISKVLYSGFRAAGEYTLDVDVSDLQAGVYYYTISSAGSKPVSKQLVVTN